MQLVFDTHECNPIPSSSVFAQNFIKLFRQKCDLTPRFNTKTRSMSNESIFMQKGGLAQNFNENFMQKQGLTTKFHKILVGKRS